MIQKFRFFLLVITSLFCLNCSTTQAVMVKKKIVFQDNFEDLENFKTYWENNSWKSPKSYALENGHLKISTRANSLDRVKVRTKSNNFTTGTYQWRIFIPEFTLYEQCSIGAFLYHNDIKEFEFDFEIGSGAKEDRDKIHLKEDEAIVYCVSQFEPSNSSHFAVKMGAYSDFTIELIDVDGFYLVKWLINNKLVKTLQTKVKSNTPFRVHASLENLHFMGDIKTTKENYVLFDSFKYQN